MPTSLLNLQKSSTDQNAESEKRLSQLHDEFYKKLKARQMEEMQANEQTIRLRRQRLALSVESESDTSAKPNARASSRKKTKN
jgi:hypothetical protein